MIVSLWPRPQVLRGSGWIGSTSIKTHLSICRSWPPDINTFFCHYWPSSSQQPTWLQYINNSTNIDVKKKRKKLQASHGKASYLLRRNPGGDFFLLIWRHMTEGGFELTSLYVKSGTVLYLQLRANTKDINSFPGQVGGVWLSDQIACLAQSLKIHERTPLWPY